MSNTRRPSSVHSRSSSLSRAGRISAAGQPRRRLCGFEARLVEERSGCLREGDRPGDESGKPAGTGGVEELLADGSAAAHPVGHPDVDQSGPAWKYPVEHQKSLELLVVPVQESILNSWIANTQSKKPRSRTCPIRSSWARRSTSAAMASGSGVRSIETRNCAVGSCPPHPDRGRGKATDPTGPAERRVSESPQEACSLQSPRGSMEIDPVTVPEANWLQSSEATIPGRKRGLRGDRIGP